MTEIWKDIEFIDNGEVYDYVGLYQISNYGNVKSLDRIDASGHKIKGKIMKCKPNKNGYKNVNLYKNGKSKRFQVHRLVAHMFVENPNPTEFNVVNHMDENPSNCRYDNLEWCDTLYNVRYSLEKHYEERQQKLAKVHKEFSEEAKQKISDKLKYRTFTEEHRQKLSEKAKLRTGAKSPNSKKVKCIETGQIFDTVKETTKQMGVSRYYIINCCEGNIDKCSRGYHWEYIKEEGEAQSC